VRVTETETGPFPQRSPRRSIWKRYIVRRANRCAEKDVGGSVRRQAGEQVQYEKQKFGTTCAEIEHQAAWPQAQGVGEAFPAAPDTPSKDASDSWPEIGFPRCTAAGGSLEIWKSRFLPLILAISS
jgi:hypothetical protein